MVDFDDLRDKVEDLAREHDDQVDSAIDKIADFAGDKFGHADEIDKGAAKLRDLTPGRDEPDKA